MKNIIVVSFFAISVISSSAFALGCNHRFDCQDDENTPITVGDKKPHGEGGA